MINTPIVRDSGTEETSVFANLTFHLGEKTELSAGARYIEFESNSILSVNGAPPVATVPSSGIRQSKEEPTVWNLALSHRFTDDFMLYGNVGTSWRDGPSVVGVFRPPTPLHHAVHGAGIGRFHLL